MTTLRSSVTTTPRTNRRRTVCLAGMAVLVTLALAGCPRCPFRSEPSVDWGERTPADGTAVTTSSPTLDWGDVTSAVSCEVSLSVAGSGSEEISTATETRLPIRESLLRGQQYEWSIRAVDVCGERSAASDTFTFTVPNDVVGGFVPADGEAVGTTAPTLDWDDVPNAVGYELQYDQSQSNIVDGGATVRECLWSQYTVSETLPDETTQYWRVRANMGSLFGPWSPVISFTVRRDVISGLWPVDGATVDETPAFGWNPTDGAESYEFSIAESQAALDSAGTVAVYGTTHTPAALADGTYVWRVRMVDDSGAKGPWSEVRTVVIDAASSDDETAGDVPRFFWGEWVRMDGTNDRWYFSNADVRVNGGQRSVSVAGPTTLVVSGETVARRTDNMVYVDDTGDSDLGYYLFRRSGANTTVEAGVRGTSAARAIARSGAQSIDVILRNMTNAANEMEATTDAEGSVTFEEVIPGDTYELTVPQQAGVAQEVSVNVVPTFNGEDVGFVTITDARQNFKVRGVVSSYDGEYLYAGHSYPLTIQVTNVGTEQMLEANYVVTPPSGVTLTGPATADILGSVAPEGGVRQIGYTISVDPFPETYRDVDIGVEIVSKDGMNRWVDNVALRVFREEMTVYLQSRDSEVQGILISPDRTSLAFATSGRNGEITVPVRERPYVLALSGADYSTETKYAFRVGARPSDNGSSVTDTRVNEPNDDETQAVRASLHADYGGYLGVYDLDFYHIYGSLADGATVRWENRSPNGGSVGTTTPTLSWDAVSSAAGYEIQIAVGDEAALESATPVSVTDTEYTPTVALANDAYHYWRLRAFDAEGTVSAWSDAYQVRVSWRASVSPSSPYSGQSITDSIPTLRWGSVTGADRYDVRIAPTSDELETADVVAVDDTSYTPPASALSMGYNYWQVRAVDAAGGIGAWSSSWYFDLQVDDTFGIDVDLGDTFPLVIAGGGATLTSGDSISFHAVAGGEVDGYAWYVDAVPAGDVAAATPDGASLTVGAGLAAGYHVVSVIATSGSAMASDERRIRVGAGLPYAIGDPGPAGGVVFYDKGSYSDGWRYLEVAPPETEWTSKVWGGYQTSVSDTTPTGTAVGDGLANTAAIVSVYGFAEPYQSKQDYAAILCANLEEGGYGDWFLPSKDELTQLYERREAVSGFASNYNYYWSSSEEGSSHARYRYFGSTSDGYGTKTQQRAVRAVRGF